MLLDATTLEVQRTVPLVLDDRAVTVAFSPDGRLFAAGGNLGLVHVLDTSTWEYARAPVAVHRSEMTQVEWLPDGDTVVSSATDATVTLFDVERGLIQARPLRASGEPGIGYAHLVPGTRDELIALGGERTGWRYPVEPSVWLREACAIVGRDLTRAEWDRYLPDRDYAPTCSDLS